MPEEPLAERRILLMPGHVGGRAGAGELARPGSLHYDIEDSLNLDLALYTRKALVEAGAHVLLGHGSFNRKAKLARMFQPDYTLELHHNAPGNIPHRDHIRGMEVWTAGDQASIMAAKALFAEAREATPIPPHGDYPGEANDGLHDIYREGNTRRALFEYVEARPLVLFEAGFLTNAEDCAWLVEPQNQDTLARALMEGVRRYFF